MLAYMKELKECSNTSNTTTISGKKEFIPLEIQIQKLMLCLPENMRKRDWTMGDLISRLDGKYRNRPHAQKVGEALARLGWTRHRDYSHAGNGARIWQNP